MAKDPKLCPCGRPASPRVLERITPAVPDAGSLRPQPLRCAACIADEEAWNIVDEAAWDAFEEAAWNYIDHQAGRYYTPLPFFDSDD